MTTTTTYYYYNYYYNNQQPITSVPKGSYCNMHCQYIQDRVSYFFLCYTIQFTFNSLCQPIGKYFK